MEDNRLDAKQREELELLMKLPPKSREKLITLAEGMVMAAELQERRARNERTENKTQKKARRGERL